MAACSLSWTGYSSVELSYHAVIQWVVHWLSLIQQFLGNANGTASNIYPSLIFQNGAGLATRQYEILVQVFHHYGKYNVCDNNNHNNNNKSRLKWIAV